MKKIVGIFIISIAIVFSYFYKSPILSEQAALMYAEEHLLNLPEEWGTIVFDGFEQTPEQTIRTSLSEKQGFWNELFNRMQWEVTIESPELNTTIVIDAHTGKFIGLFGAFS